MRNFSISIIFLSALFFMLPGVVFAQSLPTNRLYTGQIKDDTGLYYYNARYYDPYLGIFTSADGAQGPNRYSYVGGNPIMRNDPTGNVVEAGTGVGDGGTMMVTPFGSYSTSWMSYANNLERINLLRWQAGTGSQPGYGTASTEIAMLEEIESRQAFYRQFENMNVGEIAGTMLMAGMIPPGDIAQVGQQVGGFGSELLLSMATKITPQRILDVSLGMRAVVQNTDVFADKIKSEESFNMQDFSSRLSDERIPNGLKARSLKPLFAPGEESGVYRQIMINLYGKGMKEGGMENLTWKDALLKMINVQPTAWENSGPEVQKIIDSVLKPSR